MFSTCHVLRKSPVHLHFTVYSHVFHIYNLTQNLLFGVNMKSNLIPPDIDNLLSQPCALYSPPFSDSHWFWWHFYSPSSTHKETSVLRRSLFSVVGLLSVCPSMNSTLWLWISCALVGLLTPTSFCHKIVLALHTSLIISMILESRFPIPGKSLLTFRSWVTLNVQNKMETADFALLGLYIRNVGKLFSYPRRLSCQIISYNLLCFSPSF